jgi:hypothetical protein
MSLRSRWQASPVFIRHLLVRKDQGRFDTATTYEVEYPYRPGTSAVLRLCGAHALQLGILDSHPDLDDDAIDKRLLAAIRSADGGHSYWDTPEARQYWAEQAIAAHARDEAEEAMFRDQLGLPCDFGCMPMDHQPCA